MVWGEGVRFGPRESAGPAVGNPSRTSGLGPSNYRVEQEEGQAPNTVNRVFFKVVGALGRIMVFAGLFLLGFVAFQLWGTGLQESNSQDTLAAALAAPGADQPADVDPAVVAQQLAQVDPATAPPTPPPPVGEPVGFIEIPKIELVRVMVEGVSKEELKLGPGHYPGTPLPGQPGNSGIAGHRTTYGAPFNRIDELVPGDEIITTTPQGRFVYRVIAGPAAPDQAWYIVDPSDVSVLDNFGDNRITLTACHPKYSAAERIIVNAVLETPPAAAVPAAPGTGTGEQAGRASAADLGGDTDALRPAVAYGLAALALGIAAWFLGTRWRKAPAYLLVTPLILGLVWMCYTYLDRYLPAL